MFGVVVRALCDFLSWYSLQFTVAQRMVLFNEQIINDDDSDDYNESTIFARGHEDQSINQSVKSIN